MRRLPFLMAALLFVDFIDEFSSGIPTVGIPGIEATFELTYDRRIAVAEANTKGTDLDDDGLVDATFFLRAPGTRVFVAHEVPAGALASGMRR